MFSRLIGTWKVLLIFSTGKRLKTSPNNDAPSIIEIVKSVLVLDPTGDLRTISNATNNFHEDASQIYIARLPFSKHTKKISYRLA
jgi:hypothetical protein